MPTIKGDLVLAWTAATSPDPQAPILGYRVYAGDRMVKDTASTATTTTVTGLTVGAVYDVSVAAYNSFRQGPRSASIPVEVVSDVVSPPPPPELPTAPTGLAPSNTTTTGTTLTWLASTGTAQAPVLGYRVYRSGVVVGQVGNVLTAVITGLSPQTAYSFVVRAYSSAGESPNSNTATVTTLTPPVQTLNKFRAGSWFEKPLPTNAPRHPNSDQYLDGIQAASTQLHNGQAYQRLWGGADWSHSTTDSTTPIYRATNQDPIYHIAGQAAETWVDVPVSEETATVDGTVLVLADSAGTVSGSVFVLPDSGDNVPAALLPGGPGIRIPTTAKTYFTAATAGTAVMVVHDPVMGAYAMMRGIQWQAGATPAASSDTDTSGAWVLPSGAEASYRVLSSYGNTANTPSGWPTALTTDAGPGTGQAPSYYQDSTLNTDNMAGTNPLGQVIDYDRLVAESAVNYVATGTAPNTSTGYRWPLTEGQASPSVGGGGAGTAHEWTEGFESGSPGTAITSGNTAFNANTESATVEGQFSDLSSIGGTRCMRVRTEVSSTFFPRREFTARSFMYHRFYFRVEQESGQNFNTITQIQNGTTNVAHIQRGRTSQILRLRDYPGGVATNVASGTVPVPLQTWCRIEWKIDCTNQVQEVRLFVGPNVNGTIPDETLGGGASSLTGGATFNRIATGSNTASTTTQPDYLFDEVADSITDWPGPYAAATSTPTIPFGTRMRIKPTVDVATRLAADTGMYGTAGSRTAAQQSAYDQAVMIATGLQKYGVVIGGYYEGQARVRVESTYKEGRGNLWAMRHEGLRSIPFVGDWEAIADAYDPPSSPPSGTVRAVGTGEQFPVGFHEDLRGLTEPVGAHLGPASLISSGPTIRDEPLTIRGYVSGGAVRPLGIRGVTGTVIREEPPPNAPTEPTAFTYSNLTTTSLSLAWSGATAPTTAPITHYTVWSVQASGDVVVTTNVGLTEAYNVTGLSPGTRYTFWVTAHSSAGTSKAATLEVTTGTAAGAPTAPATLDASNITSSGVRLTWGPSTAASGATLTGYRVYRTTSTGTAQVGSDVDAAALSLDVTGLTQATSYTFTVRAFDNLGGESAASPARTVTTAVAAGVPSPPQTLDATTPTSAGSVTLTWGAATSAGTGLLGYRVRKVGTAGDLATTTANVTTYTLTVPSGTSQYVVVGYNSVGESPNSPTVTVEYTAAAQGRFPGHQRGRLYLGTSQQAPQTVADAEDLINAPLGLEREFYSWTQATSENAFITSNHNNNRIPWVSFKGPVAGNAGWVAIDAGDYDADIRARARRYAAFTKPIWVTFHHEPSNDGTEAQGVNWARAWAHIHDVMKNETGLVNVAFAPILGDWLFNPNNQSQDPANWARNIVLSRLPFMGVDMYQNASNEGYAVRVQRIITWMGSRGFPDRMVCIGETGSTNYFGTNAKAAQWWADSFAWAKANTGKMAGISWFNSVVNSKPDHDWRLAESVAKTEAFRDAATDPVCTRLGGGVSPPPPPPPPPPATAPGKVPNLRQTGSTDTTVSMQWDAAPTAADLPVTSYTLRRDGAVVTSSLSGTTLLYTDTGRTADTAYAYTVQATNAVGAGVESDVLTGRTSPAEGSVPSAPGTLSSPSKTTSSVTLSWGAATAPADDPVIGYRVRVNGTTVWTTTAASRTYTVGSLTAGTPYAFTVRAYNNAGNGPLTNELTVTTTTVVSPPPPPPPQVAFDAYVAGDIANPDMPTHATVTSDFIVTDRTGDDIVLAVGNLAYPSGTAIQFNTNYHPSWGRVKGITYPVPGDREGTLSGYGTYWADQEPRISTSPATYTFIKNNWLFLAVYSGTPDAGSVTAADMDIVRAALAARPAYVNGICAYWHHPRFTSGARGPSLGMDSLVKLLHTNKVDVIISAHDGHYERFRKMDPTAALVANTANGFVPFVVGTGGAATSSMGTTATGSLARIANGNRGVARFSFGETSWTAEWFAATGFTGHDGPVTYPINAK